MDERDRGWRGLLEPLPDRMPEDADDVLTRLGLAGDVDPSPTGRAARRRATQNGSTRSAHHARPDEPGPPSHAAPADHRRRATNHAAEEPDGPQPPRRNGYHHSTEDMSRLATADPAEDGSRRQVADHGNAPSHRRDPQDARTPGPAVGRRPPTQGPEPGGRADRGRTNGSDPHDPAERGSAGRDAPISQPSRPPPDLGSSRGSAPEASHPIRTPRNGALLRGSSEPPLRPAAREITPRAARHAGSGHRSGWLDDGAVTRDAEYDGPPNGHGPAPDDPPDRPDISGLLGLSERYSSLDDRAWPDGYAPTTRRAARHSSSDDERARPDLLADRTRPATHRDPPPDDSPARAERDTAAPPASRRAGTLNGGPDRSPAPAAHSRTAAGIDGAERATGLQPAPRRAATRTADARTELPGSASRRSVPSAARRPGEPAAPSDRAPSDRAPSDRAPSDRAPSDRAPSDRAPSDRAPSDRAPSDRDSPSTQQLRARDIGPALAGRRRAADPDRSARQSAGPDDTTRDDTARDNTDVPIRSVRRNGAGAHGSRAAGRSSTAGTERAHEQLDAAREDSRTAPTPAGDGFRPSSTERARLIDATLTRLTAAHAGIVLARPDDGDPDSRPTAPTERVLTGADIRAVAWERRRHVAGRLLVVAVVIAIVFAAGTGWAMQQWLDTGVRTLAALDPTSSSIVDAGAQQGAENVLLVSTATTNDDATRRPDTVAIVHVPTGGGHVTVVTVPAELQVGHPDCDRFEQGSNTYGPDTVPTEGDSTLSNTLAVGGPRCVTMAVQALTGLAVTRYVGIDLDALGVAVGAVSGISVCVPRPVVDSRLGAVAPRPGTVALNAATAGAYVHAADVDTDPPGEQGTVTRQQQVLAAVLGGTLSDIGLLDVSRVSALRAALSTALVTDNAALDQVLALARSVGRPAGDDLTFRTVPSGIDPQGGGLVPVDADANGLFAALRTGAPLPAVPGAATPAAADLADIHVDVLNASDKPGEAGRIQTVLTGLGFGVGTVANAPSAQDTVIRYSPDQAAAALVLAASVPSASTEPDPDGSGTLQLVLGTSFNSIVKPPSPTPTPSPAPADDTDADSATCA